MADLRSVSWRQRAQLALLVTLSRPRRAAVHTTAVSAMQLRRVSCSPQLPEAALVFLQYGPIMKFCAVHGSLRASQKTMPLSMHGRLRSQQGRVILSCLLTSLGPGGRVVPFCLLGQRL